MYLFAMIQSIVTVYVFVAIIIMVFKGLTIEPDYNYMDNVRHRSLVWPLELLFILRLFFKRLDFRKFRWIKKELDFHVEEVVFYVSDEDKASLVHKEITKVE